MRNSVIDKMKYVRQGSETGRDTRLLVHESLTELWQHCQEVVIRIAIIVDWILHKVKSDQ